MSISLTLNDEQAARLEARATLAMMQLLLT
jgi:hypothetical protein